MVHDLNINWKYKVGLNAFPGSGFNIQLTNDGRYLKTSSDLYDLSLGKRTTLFTSNGSIVSLVNPTWNKIIFLYHPPKNYRGPDQSQVIYEIADFIPTAQ